MNLPDSAPIVDLIEAFRRSKTMFAAVSLGIFDRLHGQSATAAELAAELGAHGGALERLLDGCAALGLLRKEAAVYSVTPLAECYLCADSPYSLDGYVRYSDEALYPMWGHLADAVKEGAPRWKQEFGVDGAIFSGFFRTDDAMRSFLRGMHGFGMSVSPMAAAAFDLGRFRRRVDLGGATGHLAIAACERFPQLRGAVFDLPRVTPMAREMVGRSPARDRIEVLDGDFFTDELPAADLYALGRILHDWTDEKCALLLRKIARRLPSGGALLVVEKFLAEDGVGPVSANMQSLNMLIVTEGRERSLSEYARLLRESGFAEVEGRTTGGWLDVVLAQKR
jgi:acetylserotonin N-methyltransferase